jgi:asparagine synthase (glutamine-hydrolysing)
VSALYGLIRLDGPDVSPEDLGALAAPLRHWGPDGGGEWREGGAGLGRLVARRGSPEPDASGPVPCARGDAVVAAVARLDNRGELSRELRVEPASPDADVLVAAYERWGGDAVRRVLGDWSFAAWHPAERRLVLARDQYGNTALYHHFDGATFAFASSLDALLALPHVPRRLNELRLAQHLALWRTDAAATLHEDIHRLPPAHLLVLDDRRVTTHEYWHPRDAPDVRLGSDDAYVERFVDLFAEAVRSRVRTTGPVASALSSGLDSSAVTGLAAREVDGLVAFTASPAYPDQVAPGAGVIVEEWPTAARVAAGWPGVEHVRLTGAEITPLSAIRRSHEIHRELEFGAANLPWLLALMRQARERGAEVLLTGQSGNGGVSWRGEYGQALRLLLEGRVRAAGGAFAAFARDAGWLLALRRQFAGPVRRRAQLERERRRRRGEGAVGPLIAPAFSRRLRIAERMRASGYDPVLGRVTPGDDRLAILLPGFNPIGALWHEHGAAHGLDVRDPTADVRLLEFCFGVPPDQFMRGDSDRWLMRRGLAGLVPDDVRWSRVHGLQGADIARRLLADAAGVDDALTRIAGSELVSAYVNVPALRERWDACRRDPAATGPYAAGELARGLNIALFLLR